MAKKAQTFREIIADIKKGAYAPVYLLMGAEPYYLDQIVAALEATVVPEEEKDFNASIFYGADSEVETVAVTARQFPMMSDRRLVILKEAQSMRQAKQQLDKLESYVLKPTATSVLAVVFKGDDLNATSALMKAAGKGDAVVFKSPKFRDYQLAEPVKDYCQMKGIGIDGKALQMLVDFVGNDLSKLFGEIDKLIVASGGAKRINPELIEENIGISKDFNNFELWNALVRKDYPAAMKIVEFFSRNPRQNPTVVTTGTLLSQFSKIVIANLSRDKSDAALMKALQLKNAWSLKDIRLGMQNYTASQSMTCISLLRDFDTKSKGIGSFANEYELLKELIYNIFIAS